MSYMSDEVDPTGTPVDGIYAVAIEMHEFYTALTSAGFNDEQAMFLVAHQLGHYNS
jgi:hypothetical protein